MMRPRINVATFGITFASFLFLTVSLMAEPETATLAPLVRAYRESSTPAGKQALEAYARSHSRDASGALADFSLGVASFENKEWAAAVQCFSRVRGHLPEISDYITYYLAGSQVNGGDASTGSQTLGDLREFTERRSPLLAKAIILKAKVAGNGAGSQEILKPATELLRGRIATSSQPEGDFALALGYDATGEPALAASYYQRVYFMYPATEMAKEASDAIDRLKHVLGTGYPAPRPQFPLERGEKWIEAKEYGKARAEFETIASYFSGVERDQARVRVGAAQFAAGDYRGANSYLNGLDLPKNEADAERWFYLEECAQKMKNDGAMMDAIKYLARHHERSVWRLKALVSAGNRYLLAHEPAQYEPLYRAAWTTFPSDGTTAYCHWKIAWDAYLANKRDAHDLLREQVEHYPGDNKSATALYYLGRLSETTNDWDGARAYYETLNKQFPNFYYAVLGRERLASSRIVAASPSNKISDWLGAIEFPAHADYSTQSPNEATRDRIERARLLAEAGLPDFADAEVRFGAKTDGQPHLLAVELARTDAAPYMSLRHMKGLAPDYLLTPLENAPKPFWRMLFPLPYSGALVANAKKQNLDPYMVAALIRQESEFNPGAHSYANAYGLTQIVPNTGRMLARQQGMRGYTTDALYRPETNLSLGTQYMRLLLDQWNGRWEQTLASYNAGASRVKEWMAWGNYREPAEFVESIPITQTREYVQAVIRNAAVYREIYGPSSAIIVDELDTAPAILTAIPIPRAPTHKASLPTRGRASTSQVRAGARNSRSARTSSVGKAGARPRSSAQKKRPR